MRSVFLEQRPWKTVSFEEKVMSKAKYVSIFLPQIEAVFNSSNFFRITRGFENWGILLGYSPVFAVAHPVTLHI